jgi:hypothetical protein
MAAAAIVAAAQWRIVACRNASGGSWRAPIVAAEAVIFQSRNCARNVGGRHATKLHMSQSCADAD